MRASHNSWNILYSTINNFSSYSVVLPAYIPVINKKISKLHYLVGTLPDKVMKLCRLGVEFEETASASELAESRRAQ